MLQVRSEDENIRNWFRLGLFLHKPLKESLIETLHKGGLPRNPAALYSVLSLRKKDVMKLKRQRVLHSDQVDIIYPAYAKKTSIEELDVAGIVVLITNFANYKKTEDILKNFDDPTYNNNIIANVLRAREWRNFFHHFDPQNVDGEMFEKKWEEGKKIIKSLGYPYNTALLKEKPLDPNSPAVKKLQGDVNELLKESSHYARILDDGNVSLCNLEYRMGNMEDIINVLIHKANLHWKIPFWAVIMGLLIGIQLL